MRRKFSLIRRASRIHGRVYQASMGKLGAKLGNVGILLLTTTGNKSGKKRHVPLAAIPYGKSVAVVASFGGSPTDPSWLTNIQHNSEVLFRIGAVQKKGQASIILPDDNRYEELWNAAIDVYAGFAHYREMTVRQIPIVLITSTVNHSR